MMNQGKMKVSDPKSNHQSGKDWFVLRKCNYFLVAKLAQFWFGRKQLWIPMLELIIGEDGRTTKQKRKEKVAYMHMACHQKGSMILNRNDGGPTCRHC